MTRRTFGLSAALALLGTVTTAGATMAKTPTDPPPPPTDPPPPPKDDPNARPYEEGH